MRVVSHDDILNEDNYKDFPRERASTPGTLVTLLDDSDVSEFFEAFIHAPFKVDAEDTSNNTSLSLQIVLKKGTQSAKALFFGDREYPTIKEIFDVTIQHGRHSRLHWDILLSSHHCSKKVMFWKAEGDDEETFKQDIMKQFQKFREPGAYIVASANSDFTDGKGDNPPHSKARKEYEKIIAAGRFFCTHERPTKEFPEPIKFELTDKGLVLAETTKAEGKSASALSAAVAAARGGDAPPNQQIGFGQE